MNHLQLSLSQQTLDRFLRQAIESTPLPDRTSETIVDESGVRVVSNVQLRSVGLESLTLSEPNIINLNNIHVEFEILNIVISVDIPRQHDEINVIDLPGERFDVEISWDFFEDNPDIELTVGLEEFIHPTFSVSMRSTIDQRNVIIGLADFQIHDLNFPSDLGNQIQGRLIDEINRKISDEIDNRWLAQVLDVIGDVAGLIPVGNFSSWIIQKLTESEGFQNQIERLIREKIRDQVVYTVPDTIPVGTEPNIINLTLASENPIMVGITNDQLKIDININDLE